MTSNFDVRGKHGPVVPYYGFVDLKRSPELIPGIEELRDWPDFEYAIKSLNAPSSIFWTLGCEKAMSEFTHDDYPEARYKLTSYTHIAYDDGRLLSLGEYADCYQHFSHFLHSGDGQEPHLVHVTWSMESVFLCDREEQPICGYCICLYVSGLGTTEPEARETWALGLRKTVDFFERYSAQRSGTVV